jgi:type IV pilus assembly protein PilM
MLNSKSFLCVDFGAGSLKVGEFDVAESGALRLLRYFVKPLGLAGSQDAAREGVILRGLQELMADKTVAAKGCNVCAPGFQVFSKFIKLPPVDSSKVTQIIQYEAQQNVPFPLEEAVWDYQIMGTMPSGELEVLLVAVKAEIVEGLFRTAESVNLRLDLVDASPAALCNAFRYNYGDLESCSMLLDIGAKTSNVLIFEKGKVYCRTINIGANSITQDFGAEAKLPFAEAEKVKIAEGFVSLGGAYEEPDNPRQAAISKIARQVMTRLHIQVNQTIQFYRSQQGGSAPQRVFLAGGASVMAYSAQFFAEKLNVGVEYFNPFRNVQIDPSISLEELAKVAHAMGEVVGLALRNPTQCPVELNLIPKSILKRQQLNQKKPYFIASVFSLILAVFAFGWFFDRVAAVKQATFEEREPNLQKQKDRKTQFDQALTKKKETQKVADQYVDWMQSRFTWLDLITELRKSLEAAQAKTTRPGAQSGVWIVKMAADNAEVPESEQQEEEGPRPMMMDIRMLMRYGLIPKGMKIVTDGAGGGGEGGVQTMMRMDRPKAPTASTNEISTINLTCRAVSWRKVFPAADSELAIALERELLASQFFAGGTNGTQLAGSMEHDETTGTFSFDVRLKLKKPIRL